MFQRILLGALLALTMSFVGITICERPASATILPDWGLEELVAHSDAVVVAKVVGSGVQVDARDGFIYTVTDLEIESYVVGSGPNRTQIRQSGGQVKDQIVVVAGNPRLVPGQRVVLFLEQRRPYDVIVAMELGAYFIDEATPAGATVRRPTTVDVASITEDGGTRLGHPQPSFDGGALDALLSQIKQLAAEGGVDK